MEKYQDYSAPKVKVFELGTKEVFCGSMQGAASNEAYTEETFEW